MAGPYKIPEGIEASPPILSMFELYGPKYIWFAMTTALLGSFATLLTATIINVAIPEVMGAFGIGQDQAQWLATSFLAAGTVTMLLTALSIEAVGVRLTFVIAMLVFLAGSLLGGVAPNPEILILSRVITGAAAGLIGPIAMVVNYQIFPVKSRGFAMGMFGIGVVLAPALGPALGGYLIDNFGWRYVFFLAVPFSIISVPLAMLFMPERDEHSAIPRFDWIGFILASIFLATFLTALSNGQREGWSSEYIVGMAGVAFLSVVTFIWWELTIKSPMLEVRIFLHGRFMAASIVTVVVGVGLYGSTYLLPIFLQTLQKIMPTDSGLLMLPAGLAMALCFPLAGALSDRVQPRIVIMTGLLLFALSSWLMRGVDIHTAYGSILIWAIIGRIGLAMIFPSLNAASLGTLPLSLLNQGSGAINFLRQLGGAFGVNLLSIHLARRSVEFSHQYTQTQVSSPATVEMLIKLQDMMFGQHFGFIMQLPMSFSFLSNAIFSQAMTMAFREGFLLIALVFLISLIPTWFMKANLSSASPDHAR